MREKNCRKWLVKKGHRKTNRKANKSNLNYYRSVFFVWLLNNLNKNTEQMSEMDRIIRINDDIIR